MNTNKVCLNCGSTDLVSDRSLGGRMVCFKCGSSSFRNNSFSPIKYKMIIYFLIGFIIFLLVIIWISVNIPVTFKSNYIDINIK